MQAIFFEDKQCLWKDVEPAPLSPEQVRIKISATAVNRADLMQRAGVYPPPPGYSDIPGLECSGTIIEKGAAVQGLDEGTQVCALLAAGGYATEVVCNAGQVLPIPPNVDIVHAAAIPEVFATAWFNLMMVATLQHGDKVFVKAGGSGVGTAVIQLCKAMGNPVVVQVGSDEKLERCIKLGANGGINRRTQALSDLKQVGPFDVIVDPVGGGSLEETLPLMAVDGRLVIIGLLAGTKGTLDIGRLLVKRLKILGSTLRSQPVAMKARIMSELQQHTWTMFESGQLAPIVDSTFSIADIDDAINLIESNDSFGKVVLKL